MSYTEIYKFKQNGDSEFLDETKNAFRGAMAIWEFIEKKYLPKFAPLWAMGDTSKEYSRITDLFGVKEIWGVYDSDKISEIDKIVLGSTFDGVIVMKDDIPKLVDAFNNFDGETTLKEQATLIEEAFETDDDLIAIGWNQTSVNCNPWLSDEEDEDGEYLPYNILRGDKHWNLFETNKE